MLLQDLVELQNGRSEPTLQTGPAPEKPAWLDVEKFNRGRQFFKDFLTSCLLSMFVSLVGGLSVNNLLQALVYTGQSDQPKKALVRYFQTFKHVCHWHYGNVWDQKSQAYRSVSAVRGMHDTVAKAMNSEKRNKELHFSQYDMALVQCGFMGCIVMYPENFGITASQEYIDDYVYFWKGIGYLLGIEDQYNLCGDGYVVAKKRCKAIEQHVLLPSLRNPPKDFQKMAMALINGANLPLFLKLISFESVIAFGLDIMREPRGRLRISDQMRLYFLRCLAFLVKKFLVVRVALNKCLECAFGCSKM